MKKNSIHIQELDFQTSNTQKDMEMIGQDIMNAETMPIEVGQEIILIMREIMKEKQDSIEEEVTDMIMNQEEVRIIIFILVFRKRI